jgi:hypothetical protein
MTQDRDPFEPLRRAARDWTPPEPTPEQRAELTAALAAVTAEVARQAGEGSR